MVTPILLIVGWTVAGLLQPRTYSPIRDSVSALAAIGTPDRWIMTLVFVLVAAGYVTTSVALRPAAAAGRVLLIAGALAGILVAASPEPPGGRFSLAHAGWSAVGLGLLTIWPLAARQIGSSAPWGLRTPSAVGATMTMAVLLTWFAAELVTGGHQLGLAERTVGVAQSLWPLIVVLSCQLAWRPTSPANPVRMTLNRLSLTRTRPDHRR